MGQLWQLLRDTARAWYEDRAQRLGAALAFYTIFALAPGLVILITVSGLVLDPETAQVRIVEQIETLIGRTGAEAIEATLVSAREQGTEVTLVAGMRSIGYAGRRRVGPEGIPWFREAELREVTADRAWAPGLPPLTRHAALDRWERSAWTS